MNEWDQRIREHPIWETMSLLGRAIDDAVKIAGTDPATATALERTRSALAFVGKKFAAADPFLALLGPFDALNSDLIQARELIIAFASGQDPIDMVNANGRVDAALSRAFEIPTISTPEEFGAVIQSAVAFRKDFEGHLADAQTSVVSPK